MPEFSLELQLWQRVLFGDDTMTARLMQKKYANFSKGDKVTFVPRYASGAPADAIPVTLDADPRIMRLKDMLTLPREMYERAGAETPRQWYKSQLEWYKDRGINDSSNIVLFSHTPPVEAADLRLVRDKIESTAAKIGNLLGDKMQFNFNREMLPEAWAEYHEAWYKKNPRRDPVPVPGLEVTMPWPDMQNAAAIESAQDRFCAKLQKIFGANSFMEFIEQPCLPSVDATRILTIMGTPAEMAQAIREAEARPRAKPPRALFGTNGLTL